MNFFTNFMKVIVKDHTHIQIDLSVNFLGLNLQLLQQSLYTYQAAFHAPSRYNNRKQVLLFWKTSGVRGKLFILWQKHTEFSFIV